jgi:hypothetical protein
MCRPGKTKNMWVSRESCNNRTVLTKELEKTKKGKNQAIHANPDAYVALVQLLM